MELVKCSKIQTVTVKPKALGDELPNVYAAICLPNSVSVGIHEYFGFKKIAHMENIGYKLGLWLDDGWWELFLQPHNITPREPLPLSKIEQSEIFVALGQN